jgi:signal transduction histidine kinase
VRVAFVASFFLGGLGLAAYVLAWLLVPLEGHSTAIATRAVRDGGGIVLALALVPALALVLVIASSLGAGWLSNFGWTLIVAVCGMVLVWRNVDADERAFMDQELGPFAALGITKRHTRRLLALRAALGAILVGAGFGLLVHDHATAGLLRPIAGVLALGAGVVVVFGPWWLTIVRDLVDARQARARAEERADMAARIHDSVLQTLALIQHQANDPQQVVTLARAQERQLRGWLFEGRPPGPAGEDAATMSAAVEQVQHDVEELHGVSVETVVVGDCVLDDNLRALVEAGREATVNAAKWSGAGEVSVFVEVEPHSVSMFVRDRGKGFDVQAVAADRRGLSESIHGRMTRHGGTATVRSGLGEGTEVSLTMARR